MEKHKYLLTNDSKENVVVYTKSLKSYKISGTECWVSTDQISDYQFVLKPGYECVAKDEDRFRNIRKQILKAGGKEDWSAVNELPPKKHVGFSEQKRDIPKTKEHTNRDDKTRIFKKNN